MSNIPANQQRAVDPFASYNSNVVNQLTRMNTYRGGESNGLIAIHPDLQVTLDSTAPLYIVNVSPGIAYKDDVFLRLSEIHQVDFRLSDNYVDFGTGFDETGYYYIVLEYNYMKSRPAPEVKIKIVKPSQKGNYTWSDPSLNNFIFLKAVNVIDYLSAQAVAGLFDADPGDGEARRRYIKEYAGTETFLPTFEAARDTSRIVYDVDLDKFWFGYSNRWDEVGSGGSIITINTIGSAIGDLCYINSSGVATKAISTDLHTGADVVVKEISTVGKGLTSGIAHDVKVEAPLSIAIGDLLYLSASTAGRVTNVRPDNFFQVVGRALTAGSTIDMIFSPKVMLTLSVAGTIHAIADWSGPTSGLYYNDIDISSLDRTNPVHATFYNAGIQVAPAEVQFHTAVVSKDKLRVSFPINTLTIDYLISSQESYGVTGGGGGGGSLDHSALVNLDFASSGHTEVNGFSPNPHSNSNHSDPASIPSGAIILFQSNTQISGYTLLTSSDDDVVYITKGSVAGGDAGGSSKGTWSSTHTHSMQAHTHGLTLPAHNHHWLTQGAAQAQGGTGYTYAVNGVTPVNICDGPPGMTPSNFGLIAGGWQYNGYQCKLEGYTANSSAVGGSSGGPSTPETDSGNLSSWRPKGINFTKQQKI